MEIWPDGGHDPVTFKHNLFITLILSILLVLTIQTAYAQVYTTSAVVNATNGCVVFTGDNPGNVTHVWFEYGMENNYTDYKSFKTANQTKNGYYYDTQCGLPMLPGYTYIVQASGDDGNGNFEYGSNVSYVIPSITPHPETTYTEYVDVFLNDGLNPQALLTYDIWQPYLGLMGGLFFGMLIAFIFINMATKQRTVALCVILLMVTGTTVWTLLPAQFNEIAQMLLICAMAGLIYWIFTKRR
jgi:hypothetical protein